VAGSDKRLGMRPGAGAGTLAPAGLPPPAVSPREAHEAGPANLSAREFNAVSDLARRTFGLELRQGKEELVSARLGKHVRKGGFQNFSDYLNHVTADRTGASLVALIDALATNHTSFLREKAHFDFMERQVLPALATAPRVEIWSAACSTGEEPYTLALLANEVYGPAARQRVRITATDISTKALAAARAAVYTEERCADIPKAWLQKYFQRGELGGRAAWRVRPEIAAMVEFTRFNLVTPGDAAALRRRYPVIFCRNVMIYFSMETQRAVVERLSSVLDPNGYLFVGHAESLSGVAHSLKYVRAAVYQNAEGVRR
jgi:chemotaxis protein methyltransferase CheR